jgi:hypothetical protein
MLQTQNPYSRERIDALTSTLAGMDPQERQAYAAQHKNDPAVIAVALNVSNILSAAERNKAMQAGMGGQPTVVDQKIAGMAPPPVSQLPENMGIGQLPTPNIQGMADGGIAGYDDQEGMAGGGMFEFAQNSEPVLRMAGGGMKKMSGSDLFEAALDMEGVKDPIERAFLKSVHRQESGGKAEEKTSNRGAAGAMQIIPATFASVADPDMDINKPLDNMRAGIRYGRQGFSAAKGDPVLAGAYYYGGPGGMKKAMEGVAVKDPKNPNAPSTIGYGQSVAQRMTDLLPIGSAQAAERPVAKAPSAPAPTRPMTGVGGVAAPQEGDTGIGGLSSLLSAAGAMAPKYLDKFAPSMVNDPKALAQAVKGSRIAGGVIGAVPAIGGALSSGAATALSNATPEQLGQLQSDIGSDTGFAAAIMNPENRPDAPLTSERAAAKVKPTYSPDDQSAAETARLLRQNTPPELQKEAVAAAKAEIPKDTLLGFGRDDVIMFGLQLLAGQSPNALQNLGTAGIGTLGAKVAREKAQTDKELAQAHKEYYKSAAAKSQAETDYLASGAKGMGAVAKMANEIFDNMMAGLSAVEKMNMSPQKRQQMQDQALAQASKYYKIELPAGLGAPQAGSQSDPLGILSKKG